MSLLTLVLMLLAGSGLWGLYRYKHLAGEVGRQSHRIPLVSGLNSLAHTLLESHVRADRLRDSGGMVVSDVLDPLFKIESSERQTFDNALAIAGSSLHRLKHSLQSESGGVLVDSTQQLEAVESIETILHAIETTNRPMRPIDDTDFKIMQRHLDDLVHATQHMVDRLHLDMSRFSDEVRLGYRTAIIVAWVALATAVGLITVLLLAFRSYVVKPFRTLLVGARLVERGQYEHEIELGTGDELSELARAINGMTKHFRQMYLNMEAEIRSRTRELVRSEQLASVGFLAAGVAHEINNPLAAIAWTSESLSNLVSGATIVGGDDDHAEQPLSEELTEGLSRVESEAYRCKGIIEKLLDFSRLGEVEREQHDVRSMVADIVAMVGKVGKYRCMNIDVTGDTRAEACINPTEIRQVMLNLITNALESVDDQGRVTIDIRSRRDRVVIAVVDDGCGMTDDVKEHLFEPFFTRRRDGTGTGLGLSITWRIVAGHGGSLHAESDGPGSGSTFRLELPVQSESHCAWTSPDCQSTETVPPTPMMAAA